MIHGDNNIEKFSEAKLLGMPNPHYTSKKQRFGYILKGKRWFLGGEVF
jgi:hypothetical protein